MNNPFCYTPSAECRRAVAELSRWLCGRPSSFCKHAVDPRFKAEVDRGKMFGVLLAADTSAEKPRLLAAYSGQVCGRADWPEFVPAVFDYLQPDGYFKSHEAEIVSISREIDAAEVALSSGKADGSEPMDAADRPVFSKGRREGESEGAYVRRRQFENAELHRWKKRERERRAAVDAERRQKVDKLNGLRSLRRQKSDALQRWLFGHFCMLNGLGEERNIIDIFADFYGSDAAPSLPPSGSGECCEPKLLQYAFAHGLKPLSMAMFWWGESPKAEVRHHLSFYPACNHKCKPLLTWMLQGLDVDANPLESRERDAELATRLKTIYDDEVLCVVSKPAGLLSVPGKSGRESVSSILRSRFLSGEMKGWDGVSPLIVHRLDMDTSGLMVIAKTIGAYHCLQRQFARHEISKRYVAVLSKPWSETAGSRQANGETAKGLTDGRLGREGTISLPLRPDFDDRPRQVVDFEHGRTAITEYQYRGNGVVWLWPKTGRTHQLRVHCAHRLGLDNPIKGDRLYGSPASRLFLHAAELTFRHPVSGRLMTFTDFF